MYVTRPGVMARELEDETVILDTVSGAYFRLNETGSLVWSRLATAASAEALAEHLVAVCGISREVAHRDVAELLDDLRSRGLISVAE
jgi:hypothetical protein